MLPNVSLFFAALLFSSCATTTTEQSPTVTVEEASATQIAIDSSVDLREAYDVLRYELDLHLNPDEKQLSGTGTTHARVTAEFIDVFQIDLRNELTVSSVKFNGADIEFAHTNDSVLCQLPGRVPQGEEIAIEVAYSGHPTAKDNFSGFHWAETADGSPWINTSCQGPGAHSWWPCKASFYHPEDKPESISIDITLPKPLYAVSNGRLEGIDDLGATRTFHWQHDYPLETYAVTLNAAPYVVVETELELDGHDDPLPFSYYVLPENAEKAAIQFQQVPELLKIYGDAFGPFPFEKSKFGLVETNFWGMEHSTAIAYGSSYPAWCEATGETDRYARRNKFFDYILIHEVAHEWWGNAVSATEWGHFWIHEGFGTYAEGVYVERTAGRERADEYFVGQQNSAMRSGVDSRLYRGEDVTSGEAYAGLIYSKGASVLNTMRVYMNDDDAWWKALREFNLRFRYGNASSDDFRDVLEEISGRSWEAVFASWVYGEGYPMVTGTVQGTPTSIEVSLENTGSGQTSFEVPMDLEWSELGQPRRTRVMVRPGEFAASISCESEPSDVRVMNFNRVLGKHEIVVL
ncbi:MAG: aminopeptidase N [Planctomycetota bacterium]|jgi:aminopeptidase N